MKTPLLLDVPKDRPTRAERIKEFKAKHGILSLNFKNLTREECPWMVLIPKDEDKGKTIGTIIAESCRLYDNADRTGYGASEWEAIEDLCSRRNLNL